MATLNMIFSVRDDLKYWMMVERYLNFKEKVGGSIPDCEISSLPDRKLARWSTISCALALACWPSVSEYLYTIFSVTYYLELRNAISIYCTSHSLPTNIKLVVWTL